MKSYKFLLPGLMAFAMAAVSCGDDEEVAGNQLQLGESGCVTMQFSYQKTDTVIRLNVVNRNMEANDIRLEPFTQTELDAYNQQWGTHYLMMPEDAYQLASTSVSFAAGEREKGTELTFYPDRIYRQLLTQLESAYSYCLPLKMAGNEVADEVIYVANLTYPEMRITSSDEIELSVNAMTESVELSASMYDSGVEIGNGVERVFSLGVPSDKEEWLATFNQGRETPYRLLPEGYYNVTEITGAADASSCTGKVNFERRPEGLELLPEGEYVLPLVPRKLSAEDDMVLRYDTVAVLISNPEHVFTSSDKVNRDGWRIVFCNSDMGVWNSDGIITNILDGDQNTFWASWYQWWDGQDTWFNDNGRGDDWCDYGLEFLNYKKNNGVGDMFSDSNSEWRLSPDYIFIAGNRDNPTFVIDLGQEYVVSEVGMCHRSQTQYAQTKSANIFLSNDEEFKMTTVRDGGTVLNYGTVDENNWTQVCTITTERTTDEFWAPATMNDALYKGQTKARFLKFVNEGTPLPENNASHDSSLQYAGVGEIWIKVVETIDGIPVDEVPAE